jgi:hypothetical protein
MKLKFLLLFYLLFVVQICFAQKSDAKLSWEQERPLTWKDFKGREDNSSPFHALTNGSIAYRIANVSGNEYKFVLEVGFVYKGSWVKKKMKTDKLLEHEQRHFDIVEIYARIFVKRLEEENVFEGKKFSEKVPKIYKKMTEELNKFQQQYDKETHHSTDEVKQAEWNEKIKLLLEENKAYAKREILFKIK